MKPPREHYRGNLPHFQQPGQWFFITCCLAGAIPAHAFADISKDYHIVSERYHQLKLYDNDELKTVQQEYYFARKKYFRALENLLQHSPTSKINLVKRENRMVIENALRYWEGKRLHNHAWCIMPNHFHWVVTLYKKDDEGKPVYLQDITHSIKSFTANQINKNERLGGQLWLHESFETTIRNEKHFTSSIDYILRNPVIARFVDDWRKWPGIYCELD